MRGKLKKPYLMKPFLNKFLIASPLLFQKFSASFLPLKFQAETSEDLYDWKTALEHALAQAPSAALVMGHGIFRNDANDTIDGSFHQCLYIYLITFFMAYKSSINFFF